MRLAERTATAAYWAAWSDMLPELRKRDRALAQELCGELDEGANSTAPCLQEAAAAATLLEQEGWEARPTWQELMDGAQPQQPGEDVEREPGEWRHGWQYHSSSTREKHFRTRLLLHSLAIANIPNWGPGTQDKAIWNIEKENISDRNVGPPIWKIPIFQGFQHLGPPILKIVFFSNTWDPQYGK